MNNELLRAIAAKLTMSELQELIVRAAINDVVANLHIDQKQVSEHNVHRNLDLSRYFHRLQSPTDLSREVGRLVSRYTGSKGWREAIYTGKIVALTNEAHATAINALVDMNDMDRGAINEYGKEEKKEARERIKARSDAINQLEA